MKLRQAWTAATCVAAVAAVVLVARPPYAQEHKPALGHEAPAPEPRNGAPAATTTAPPAPAPPAAVDAMIERGAYLVRIGGCNDCHTPLKDGPDGPEPDLDRMLSGHPEELTMPAAPKLPAGPWSWVGAVTNTAFAGPWGVSYGSNLTPDEETGMGAWTEQIFIDTMRTGRHRGAARPILPPMPWQNVARLTDEDLSSMYRYLASVPAIKNKVPEAQLAAR